MSGTKTGALRAAETNKRLYGNDWYAKIGAKGGSKTGPKGFALNRDLASTAGAIGGSKSRRRPTTNKKLESLQVGDCFYEEGTPRQVYNKYYKPARRMGIHVRVSAHGNVSRVLRTE